MTRSLVPAVAGPEATANVGAPQENDRTSAVNAWDGANT